MYKILHLTVEVTRCVFINAESLLCFKIYRYICIYHQFIIVVNDELL